VKTLPDKVDLGDVVLDWNAERQRVLVDNASSHVEQLTWDTCIDDTHHAIYSSATAADCSFWLAFCPDPCLCMLLVRQLSIGVVHRCQAMSNLSRHRRRPKIVINRQTDRHRGNES